MNQDKKTDYRKELAKEFLVAMITKTPRLSYTITSKEEVEHVRAANVLGAVAYADLLIKTLEKS